LSLVCKNLWEIASSDLVWKRFGKESPIANESIKGTFFKRHHNKPNWVGTPFEMADWPNLK
jgi:hypothetical protein